MKENQISYLMDGFSYNNLIAPAGFKTGGGTLEAPAYREENFAAPEKS